MIDLDRRKAIYLLNQEGMSIREISRRMHISIKTVRGIIKLKGMVPDTKRQDCVMLDPELLTRLYNECEGYVQRIHEKLAEEEGIQVGYSTLTRMIREMGLGETRNERCDRVPDEPGREMQHDTSVYKITTGDTLRRVVASILYIRYSKQRYLKFYRSFNRFRMKCFLHEALTFFGYSAHDCIIDNTNLARLRGTGKNAVIVPEMERFARQYGFIFICHEVGHANRKAGNERSFYTVETNFFPGRRFASLEDLNSQALEWSTVRMANRGVGKPGLIPAKAFEYEKAYLVKLPPAIPAPYLPLPRIIDQYGYAEVDSNYYWVPGTDRGKATVLQYSNSIKIYRKRELLAEYTLPPEGVKNEAFSPEGEPRPKYKPRNRHNSGEQEEKRLRGISDEIGAYLEFALKPKGKERHRYLRELFRLSQKIAAPLFIKTIQRALKYRITDIQTIERIAVLQINDGHYEMPSVEIDGAFQERETYLEGRITDSPDLSIYNRILEEEEDG